MTNKQKVLIVDDSKSVINILKHILGDSYDLREALNGEDALKISTDFRPDLILLDVEMPGINGYEVCQRIRADDSLGFVKIIILSSRTKLKNRLEGYGVGVDDYIGKPFEKEELLAKVRVFMRLRTVEDELHELNNQLNERIILRTKQLIDAQKMATIGRHAAGIVHNLNSPLQVMMGNSELLALKYPGNPNIMNLKKAADQMKKIIATLLLNSRRENTPESIMIDLNEVIKDQIELFKADQFFKHNIDTELQLEPLPQIRGIYAHFSQSLGNLIKNAIEAMYDSDTKWLFIESWAKRDVIFIRISDTGTGIDEENLGNIFKPFYTTKPLTSSENRPIGTGLGLPSSKEMIESYGGQIFVESEVGKGTTFKVMLPANNHVD